MNKQEFINKWIPMRYFNDSEARGKMLSDLESLDNWISCAERLPNEHQAILFLCDSEIYFGRYDKFDDEFGQFIGNMVGCTYEIMNSNEVSHWQPLPSFTENRK